VTARQPAKFVGVASRGRMGTMTGVLLDRVGDDKIAEHWAEPDLARFLQVLGAE
jgi:predicted ester cyclase